MMKRFFKILKITALTLFALVIIGAVTFAVWYNTGYDKAEDYFNPYFKAGDETFITEAESAKFKIGFAKHSLTQNIDLQAEKYFMGGYFTFPATRATEIIDGIYVRAVTIDDNSGRGAVAIAVIDSVGLSNVHVNEIRKRLDIFATQNNIKSINVFTTHNHCGIDTLGLWGPLPKTGLHPAFMKNLIEKTAESIQSALLSATHGDLYFGEASGEGLFLDHRKPEVMDESVVRLRFVPDNDGKEIYIVHLASHPEALMHGNSKITSDFPAYMGKEIERQSGGEFIFINGAIGGLINSARPPSYHEGMTDLEAMIEYGIHMGELIMSIEDETLVSPIVNIRSQEVFLPLKNPIFRFAGKMGVIQASVVKSASKDYRLVTEIAYLELGTNLKAFLVPGEIFPELATGGTLSASEAYLKTDWGYPLLKDLIPEGDKLLIFGLANDEIGYIIPDNDFGVPKFLPHIRTIDGHYEETVSLGPNTASILIQAYANLIASARG